MTSSNSEGTSFLELTAQAADEQDFFNVIANEAEGNLGEEFTQVNSTLGLVDNTQNLVISAISEVSSALGNVPLQEASGLVGALNALHSVRNGLDGLRRYVRNVECAEDADGVTGGLSLIGNTAGSLADLLAAAGAALGLAALALGGAAPAGLLIATASLGTVGTVMTTIQSAVNKHSNLVQVINDALQQAQLSGQPVVLSPPGSYTSSDPVTGVTTTIGPDGTPISPLIITRDDNGDWERVRITPEQRDNIVLLQDDVPPPIDTETEPEAEPTDPTDPPETDNGGGGNSGYKTPTWLLEILAEKRSAGGGNPGGPGGPGGPSGGDKVQRDPLILDLDGDGIELTDISAPPIFFDADGDDVATLTGWVDPDDGLLARDLDNNGRIETQKELFGTNTIDAITDLALEDSNFDGRIDAEDAIWTTLRLWRDLNQDGQSSSNELQTMAEAGLLSISLDATREGIQRGDNVIYSTTTYETEAGQIGTAAAVFFGIDNLANRTIAPAIFEADSPFQLVPNVKGYGTMPDLRSAAFLDPVLKDLVDALVADAETLTGAEFQTRFEVIALRWAGVEDVDPGTDPNTPNQQNEAFLEAFRGQDRPDTLSTTEQLVGAKESYFSTMNSLALRFGIELVGINFNNDSTEADFHALLNSPFFALSFLSPAPDSGLMRGNLERVLYEIGARLPSDTSEAFDKLDKVMSLIAALRDEYFPEPRGEFSRPNEDFDAYMAEALPRYIDNPMLVEFALTAVNAPQRFAGTPDSDDLTLDLSRHGQAFERAFPVDLGAGDDNLRVEQDSLFVSAAWEVAYVYRSGDGSDVIDISNAFGMHKLFLPNIPAQDMSFAPSPSGLDGVVTFADGETITFVNLFDGTTSTDRDLSIFTADGETITASGVATGGLFVSTEADETLTGTDLPDVYVYERGDGADIIEEDFRNNDPALDRISFVGIDLDDVIFADDNGDLLITFKDGVTTDSLRIIDQQAVQGFFSTSSSFRIEEFSFADGTVLTAQEVSDGLLAAQATAGDDVIIGNVFDDTLILSNGTDDLSGGNGGDTYIRGAGVTGDTTIDDNGGIGEDRLVLEGIELSDVSFSTNLTSVILELPNGSVTLENQRPNFGAADVIDTLVFDDVTLSNVELVGLLFPITGAFNDVSGTSAGETIESTQGNDRINGLDGDDLLLGRNGSDIYVFGTNSGDDTIRDIGQSPNKDFDRVEFTDLNPDDIFLYSQSRDVIVEVAATGQTLTLEEQLGSGASANAIEGFVFADGTVWMPQDIAANTFRRGTNNDDSLNGGNGDENFLGLTGDDTIIGGRGNDVYAFRPGDGADSVVDGSNNGSEINTLRLFDTTLNDITVNIVSNGIFFRDLSVSYGMGDTVLIDDGNDEDPETRSIQLVELSDGTVLSDEDLRGLAAVFGTDGDDVLDGATRIDGRGGDDVLTSRSLDTDFLWRVGSGSDTIDNLTFENGSGRVVFENVRRSDVSLSRDGDSLVITVTATGDTITVLGQFTPALNTRKAGVETLVFTDATLDRNEIANLSLAMATTGEDTIIGGTDDEALLGLQGADLLQGRGGSDTYFWSKGDGNDTIIEADEDGFDTLRLIDVRGVSDIEFSRVGGTSDDLVITIVETGETLTLPGQLDVEGVERIEFTDGTTLSLEGLSQLVPRVDVSDSNVLDGTDGNDVLEGKSGDDQLNGGNGSDGYIWKPGDGSDTIREEEFFSDESSGEEEESELLAAFSTFATAATTIAVPVESTEDVLRMIGVIAADVAFARIFGTNDLAITYLPSGETITIANQFLSPFAGIERIVFDDQIFGRADIAAELGGETFEGDGTAQTMTGGIGPDVFTLSSADETVQAGGGNDRIVIASGGGSDRIEEFDRGVNGTIIEFVDAPFANFDAVLAASTQTADGVRIDLGNGDDVLLVGLVLSDLEAEDFGFARPAILGTEENDEVLGTLLDDRLQLGAGDDEAAGFEGDDFIDAGEGRDVVYFGGSSTGYSITRDGARTIVEDIDTSDGNTGTDTIDNAEALVFLGDGTTVLLGNSAPIAATEGNAATGFEDSLLVGALPAATDPDDDAPLSYAVAGAALAGLTLDSDGSFTFQPGADFNGSVSFEYTVSDPLGAVSAPETFIIDIEAVNDAPVLTSALADQSFAEDTAVSFELAPDSFSDVDGDALTLSATGPNWLVFDAETRAFSGTPPANVTGSFDVTVTASDGALSVADSFSLTLTPVNDAPVLSQPLTDRSGLTGQAIAFALAANSFTDVDDEDLILAATQSDGSSLPSWLVFDANAGAFSGVPPTSAAGSLEIRVTASDGEFTAQDDFVLTIEAANNAPTPQDDDGFSTDAGVALTLSPDTLLANDTDPDGDTLTLVAVGGANNGVVALSDGQIVFTPNVGVTGAASFAYTVSDGTLEATATVSLDVLGTPDNPYSDFRQGTDGSDILFGSFFSANQIFGAGGSDLLFGGIRGDHLAGGDGNDRLLGFAGSDVLEGNDGNDLLFGSSGNDILDGGAGKDRLFGGSGSDEFIYADGYGQDQVRDFTVAGSWWWWRGKADTVQLDVDGVTNFADVLDIASQTGRHTKLDFGDGDELTLLFVDVDDLTADHFQFV